MTDAKTIQDRTIADSKGGPRMKHVVDQIIDFQFFKTTVSNPLNLLVQAEPVARCPNYLYIEGVEPNQTAARILKRFFEWITCCCVNQTKWDNK